jgi:hypothetical protein
MDGGFVFGLKNEARKLFNKNETWNKRVNGVGC